MILLELKHFFKEHKEASVLEAAQYFKVQPSAAQGMIDFWLQKGCLIPVHRVCSKGSCGGCSMATQRYCFKLNSI